MADAGDILNNDEIFGDVVETPKEDTEQHRKREELKSIIDKDKLGHKWTHDMVDKAKRRGYKQNVQWIQAAQTKRKR